MRIITTSAAAFGAALLLGIAGASPSFAKAHDQGVANPNSGHERGESQRGGTGVGGPGGISAGVNGGQRGDQASDPETGRSEGSRAGGASAK
jgi:hypothetical protein